MRTLITNGTIVTADGSYAADILIDGETIASIGHDLAAGGATADETIDATGKYVIPGGIDVHTHMELPFGGTFAKDTFETGTRAAAFGGTTSIVDFAVQSRGESLREGLDAWHAKAEGNAVTDYGFHMIMSDVNDDTLAEMDGLVAEGVPDFKLFTAYPGVFYSDDGAIFRAMQQTAKNGGLIMMHAENGMAIDVVAAQTVDAGTTDPIGHGLARKAIFEGEATNRVIRLAEAAEAPIYIVHLSAREALAEIRAARDRGTKAFAETCPQYLFLSLDDMGNGFEGAKFVCSPPLRTQDHWDELWTGLVKDDLQLVATDHCPFDFHGQKELGRGDFRKVPNGLPGVEDRVDLLHDGGVADRPDHEGALGGDHLDRAGQAVRHVPAEGRHRGRGGRGPRGLRPDTGRTSSRRRPTTWTWTTRATRAGPSRAAATSSCRAARSSCGTASSPGARATASSSSGPSPTTSGCTEDGLETWPADGSVVVLDGGLATELTARGHDLTDRLWSARLLVTDPAAIEDVHLAYFRAGARVATTASYQASVPGFEAVGLDRVAALSLIRRSVDAGGDGSRSISRCVGRRRPAPRRWIHRTVRRLPGRWLGISRRLHQHGRAGGPHRIPPAAHRSLAEAGADLLAFETIPTVTEAEILVDLLDEVDLPAWLSYACRDGTTTSAGEPFETAVAVGARARIVAVGVNCTAPRFVPELLGRAATATDRPRIAYPNGGDRWDPLSRRWLADDGGHFDPTAVATWTASGATWLGGCCGTGPDDIVRPRGGPDRPTKERNA